jgi:hypothetical protein
MAAAFLSQMESVRPFIRQHPAAESHSKTSSHLPPAVIIITLLRPINAVYSVAAASCISYTLLHQFVAENRPLLKKTYENSQIEPLMQK